MVSGSVRFLLPSLLYLILYAYIIGRWGMEVFGLWSLFAAAMSYASLADVGLSQTLLREGGADIDHDKQQQLQLDHAGAVSFYVALTAALAVAGGAAAPLLSDNLSASLSGIYSPGGVAVAMLLTLVGACAKQVAKLDFAVLGALGRNAVGFRVQTVGQLLLLAIAFGLAWLGLPVEGLALGFLASGFYERVKARALLASEEAWPRSGQKVSLRAAVGRVGSMIGRGKYLYASSLGGLIREPLFRWIVTIFYGLAYAGFFEVALRVAKTTREGAVFGFSATFPYFAKLHRQGDKAGLEDLIRWTLAMAIVMGTLPLSVIMIFADPIFHLWLGRADAPLVVSTIALSLWMWMTLLNIPFWYAALASHRDREAALSIWAHAAGIILLVPFVPLIGLSYYGALAVWVVSALATQVFIIFIVARDLGSLALFRKAMLWRLVVSVAIVTLSAAAPFLPAVEPVWRNIGFLAVMAGLYALLILLSREDLLRSVRMLRPLPER